MTTPATPTTPAGTPARRRLQAPEKALLFWAFFIPFLTLLAWLDADALALRAGYLLPFAAMGACAAVFVAALLIGLLTRTFFASLAGTVIGFVLGWLIVVAVLDL